MTAAMTMLPALCCSSSVDRKMSSLLPAVLFEPLSCGKRGFDDVNEHYFSRKSLTCWDKFYKRHQNKFFKDRHYLEKDWGKYFSDGDDGAISANGKVLLEIGCGAGNTIFPLIAAYPKLFVHACDFSTEALTLVKEHPNFNGDQINLFICDVANDELCEKILPSSVDIVTLIFMLSAVSPKKMPFVLQNLKKVLKPNGHILVRDYAVGDSAQVKLENKNQMISNNFYFRGDGTCSFYFSEDFLSALFVKAGFGTVDMNIYCRQVENRFRNMAFQRRWIRAIFTKIDS
ncbi:uncharacterized methyltransferase C3H7.11-like isoform X2 [Sesamum indicum]|uniref:tRNA N(3)-methylcytidine methyltransferase n=1 Tax=Sesamum indicum TaxID=4182 RepID=A0A8M8ULY7_SESIN|nr:uncharacterized methyltransferase C3H7.11-like isoform X2 [Sesamum indicum]